jgi:hypothetical protein
MVNIFQDGTKSIPKKSENIVRVPMDELEIGGRKDHLPAADKSEATLVHVANSGGKSGGQ